MKVIEVMQKYHTKVPFPWSVGKISKAGYAPLKLITQLINDLVRCEDNDDPLVAKTIKMALNS